MSDDRRPVIRSAAARFLDAAFAALSEEHVLPTARYHPHIRVGRDYFGGTIHALPEHHELGRILANEFPERFSDEVALMKREFADSYIFNFLEAAVARGTRRGAFDSSSTASAEAIDDLITALEGETCEVACCRVVSHITTAGEPVTVAGVTVVPERHGVREFERLIGDWIPAGGSVFIATRRSRTVPRTRYSSFLTEARTRPSMTYLPASATNLSGSFSTPVCSPEPPLRRSTR
jgi:hypothetical protein